MGAADCPSDKFQSYPNLLCIFEGDQIEQIKIIGYFEDCIVILCMVWLIKVSNQKIQMIMKEDPYNQNNLTYCQLTLYVF